MAKFCTKCGHEVDNEAVICPNCGTEIVSAVKAVTKGQGGESFFDGGVLGWIGHSILFVLLCIIPIIGVPFGLCNMGRWIASHTVINGNRLRFTGSAGSLLGSWIIWVVLTVITVGIYGFWVPTKVMKWIAQNLTYAED